MSLEDTLQKCFEENYQAHLMTVVLYGDKPLDELQASAETAYGGIDEVMPTCQ